MTVSEQWRPRDFRAAALALASKGFRVFPLIENKKVPVFDDFAAHASGNSEVVAGTWTQAATGEPEQRNIAIYTGDDVFALDFDVKHGQLGLDDFKRFDAIGLDLSVLGRTPTGGIHALFRAPPGAAVANSRKKIGPGTDVRGVGGYIVAPGSDVPEGKYEWIAEPPSIAEIPIAPDWLIQLCGRYVERDAKIHEPPPCGWDHPIGIELATEYLLHRAPNAVLGGRGSTALVVAYFMRDFGISKDRAFEMICEHWNVEGKVDPPADLDEIQHSTRSAYRYPQNKAGCKLPPELLEPKGTIDAPNGIFGKLRLESFEEATDAALHSEANWLVKGLLDIGSVSVVYAEPNAGKSFVAAELAHCIATGRPFAKLPVKPGAALYVSLEGANGFRWRLVALKKHRPVEGKVPLDLASGTLDLFARKSSVDEIIAAAESATGRFGMPIHLVVIDTLARTMTGGDESATKDMGVIVERAGLITTATGAHVMLVHHSGKDASKGARGSMALRAGIDTELEIKADERKPNEPAAGKIIVRKQREHDYLPPIKFRLRKVNAGVTADLETKTSCIVDFPITVERPGSDLSPVLRLALQALKTVAPNGEGVSAGEWDRAISQAMEAQGQQAPKSDAAGKHRLRLREKGVVKLGADKKYRVSEEFLPTFEDVGT